MCQPLAPPQRTPSALRAQGRGHGACWSRVTVVAVQPLNGRTFAARGTTRGVLVTLRAVCSTVRWWAYRRREHHTAGGGNVVNVSSSLVNHANSQAPPRSPLT